MYEFIVLHPLLSLLAGATAATFIWLAFAGKRLGIKWYSAAILAALHVLCGVLCVKFFAVIEAGFDFSKFSGQSLFGAIFFLPLFYFIGAKLFKKAPADVFDVFTVPMAFTLFCARISCIFTGCCAGKSIPGTELLWPTREAELVFYAAILAFLIPRVIKKKGRGTAYPIFMFAYGAFRFICEFFRYSADQPGIFHLSHLWAIISFALGLSIYFEINLHTKKRHAK